MRSRRNNRRNRKSVQRAPRERVYTFRRSAVGHFYVANTSSTTAYKNQGDTWTFNLATGMTSALGKFIDSGPDTTSTISNITIPNVTEFTALFDLYRIKNVHVKLLPMYQPDAEGGTLDGSASMVYSLSEKNAGGVMSLTDLLQREDARIVRLSASDPIEMDYKPLPLIDANSGGTATLGVTLANDPWLSTASLDVATMSGIRVFFDSGAAPAGSTQLVIVFLSYDLEFKCVI